MIANGVLVSFDLVTAFAIGGIVAGAYAAVWAIPRIINYFR